MQNYKTITIDNSIKKKRIVQFYYRQCHYFYFENLEPLFRSKNLCALEEFYDDIKVGVVLKKKGNKEEFFKYSGKDEHGNPVFSTEGELPGTSKNLKLAILL